MSQFFRQGKPRFAKITQDHSRLAKATSRIQTQVYLTSKSMSLTQLQTMYSEQTINFKGPEMYP